MLKGYPNPFTENLNIDFIINEDTHVKLEVFNLAGQKLATLIDADLKAAELHHAEFFAGNYPEGMILYRLQTEKGSYFGKAIIAK